MTTQQLARRENGGMTVDQVDLLKRTLLRSSKGTVATDDELALFLNQCARTGLSPWDRQICAVFRWDKKAGREVMTIQTTIDGYRLIADRTGKYEGQTTEQWCGPDGKWMDVWLETTPPRAARVGVFKTGFREPLYGVALWDEYAQKFQDGNLMGQWAEKPALMIAKCAEAKALRKAFPHETSGLYTTDEYPAVIEGEVVEETSPRQIAAPAEMEDVLIASVKAQLDRMDPEHRLELSTLVGGGVKKLITFFLPRDRENVYALLERLRSATQHDQAEAGGGAGEVVERKDVSDPEAPAPTTPDLSPEKAAEFDAYARAGGEPHRESRKVPDAKPSTLGTGVAEAAQPELATAADDALADRLRGQIPDYGDPSMPTPTTTRRTRSRT